MKKRFSLIVAVAGLLAVCLSNYRALAQDSNSGQWIIEPARGTDLLQLTLTYSAGRPTGQWGRGSSITSFGLALDQLRGLTQAQMMSAGTNVQFQLVRDAGAFNCEGWFKGGRGSGHFVFVSNPAFVTELKRRDYPAPTEAQLFSMAMNEVGIAFIEELKAQGYERPTLDQLVSMGDHGVTLEYVRGLKAQGYAVQSIELLTRMVDHGVSLSFIKEMEALGYKRMPVETLIRTVDHGVTPDYVRELEALGHSSLTLDQLTRLVDHGVNARFIKKMKSRGFNDLTIDELIKLADRDFNN